MSQSNLRAVSLFSGIGGFDLGFEAAGIAPVAMCEFDENCQNVLQRHWPTATIHPDVTRLDGADLPSHDILSFGSPCQGLSLAGQRKGIHNDERSSLFFEAIRVIRESREAGNGPEIIIWENVPGALSSGGGEDFWAALNAIAELGPLDIGWRVLDAQHFGTPQRRRRLFVVADFGGERAGEILLDAEGLSGTFASGRGPRKNAAPCAPDGTGGIGGVGGGVANTLTNRPTRGGGYAVDAAIAVPAAIDLQQVTSPRNRSVPRPLAPTLNTLGTVATFQPRFIRNGRGEYDDSGVTGNLTAQAGESGRGDSQTAVVVPTEYADVPELHWALSSKPWHGLRGDSAPQCIPVNGYRARFLTPTEYGRLQGFPEGWNNWLSDSARYKQYGNAVNVAVSSWLGHRISEVMTCR